MVLTVAVLSPGFVQANSGTSGRSTTLQDRKTTAPTLSDVRIPVAPTGKAASASRIAIAIRFNDSPCPSQAKSKDRAGQRRHVGGRPPPKAKAAGRQHPTRPQQTP